MLKKLKTNYGNCTMNEENYYTLSLGPEIKTKHKRPARKKIFWTEAMIEKLTKEFPFRITIDICNEIGISLRSAIRKARELGLVKENGFLEKNRQEISRRATLALPPQPTKGLKGWSVPGGENYRFKKGQTSIMKNRDIVEKVRASRNETIRIERIRLAACLPQKTKLKLV